MNENLDLTKILKDCPKGTKLYSPLYGDVELVKVHHDRRNRPIEVKLINNNFGIFAKDGRICANLNGECLLFPSKDQRDWSKFKIKKPKFDPKTLKPFDKVLVKLWDDAVWGCTLFSHYVNNAYDDSHYVCIGIHYKYCIPYNDDTKHLVGTSEEAPEFYRYWED